MSNATTKNRVQACQWRARQSSRQPAQHEGRCRTEPVVWNSSVRPRTNTLLARTRRELSAARRARDAAAPRQCFIQMAARGAAGYAAQSGPGARRATLQHGPGAPPNVGVAHTRAISPSPVHCLPQLPPTNRARASCGHMKCTKCMQMRRSHHTELNDLPSRLAWRACHTVLWTSSNIPKAS